LSDNIISYFEMCGREGVSLQRGMNFRVGGNHSVILMSLRPNAPYRDRLEDDGTTLIYEGHDYPKTPDCNGIWAYNGVFHLVDSWTEHDNHRSVFKFRLIAIESDEDFDATPKMTAPRRRIIPTSVKLAVWKRDGGNCVICGAADELHFDHDLPWSKGGTSITEENVQLLCARHNLQKHDRIV
jgi:HNH endonuclease